MRFYCILKRKIFYFGSGNVTFCQSPASGGNSGVLGHIELVTPALLCKQGVVIAAFNDLSVIHDDDQIRVPDGRQTVGNHDAGTVAHHHLHRILNRLFGAGIHIGGRLIQNKDFRIGYISALMMGFIKAKITRTFNCVLIRSSFALPNRIFS